MPTFGPVTVATDANDGFEYGTSWISAYEFMIFGNNGSVNRPALRWTNITVPNAATITSASIVYDVQAGTVGSPDGDWKADVGANRQNALASGHRPNSGWTQSTATGTQPAVTGAGLVTVDVTSVVQELVNLAGWASGDSACFGGYPTTGASNVCYIDDVFDAGGTEATLEIVYTTGGGGVGFPFHRHPMAHLLVR